jgi:hypothetical protein
MDKESESLFKQLFLSSEIELAEFGMKSILTRGGQECGVLESLAEEKIKNEEYRHLAWSFNGHSLGDYCRLLNSLTTEILEKINSIIYYSNIRLPLIRSNIINPFLDNIDLILEYELTRKANIENNSLILNKYKFEKPDPTGDVLLDSILRIFQFRRNELQKLSSELKIVIDNYEFHPEQYKRFILFKRTDPIGSIGTVGFCWNKNRDINEDLVKFHTLLRENDFLEKDISINLLKSAFSCSFLKTPLNIKWTKHVKGKSSKALLFHFIDELEHYNYINITEQNLILFEKIRYVFCDINGVSFENLEVSKSQWLNQRKSGRTPQENQIDNILSSVYYS